MRRLLLILTIVMLTIMVGAQGLFKPVPATLFKDKGITPKAGENYSAWLPRISAGIVANQFTYNKDTEEIEMSAFSKVGLGMSYAHYILIDDKPYNNYSFSGFVFFPTEEPMSSLSLVATISTLRYINLGMGYDFGIKKVFALTGVAYTF